MKKRKIILLAIVGIIVVGCIVFSLNYIKEKYIWPSKPEPVVYLDKITPNWKSAFHISNQNSWQAGGDKVVFTGSGDSIGKITLFSTEISSEHKKPGRMMVEVTMCGDFDNIDDGVVWGLQFGNRNDPDSAMIILGVNGRGRPVKIKGNIRKQDFSSCCFDKDRKVVFGVNSAGQILNNRKKIFADSSDYFINKCKDDIRLSFAFRDHYGLIGYYMRRCNKTSGGGRFLYKDLYEKDDKSVSLFVYDPTGKSKIWFKDWQIYNDWMCND